MVFKSCSSHLSRVSIHLLQSFSRARNQLSYVCVFVLLFVAETTTTPAVTTTTPAVTTTTPAVTTTTPGNLLISVCYFALRIQVSGGAWTLEVVFRLISGAALVTKTLLLV